MSKIDKNSLVFALPDDSNPDGKMIMCQMPVTMIMNWMFVVHPHADNYRRVQSHYLELSTENGIDPNDYEAVLDYSNDAGMSTVMQTLMMNVITDLHQTMGMEDFLDLYRMETDEEDDAYLSEQGWVGLNQDGTTHKAKMVNETPEYDSDSLAPND